MRNTSHTIKSPANRLYKVRAAIFNWLHPESIEARISARCHQHHVQIQYTISKITSKKLEIILVKSNIVM
jgi:hypothetical protein